MRKAISNTALSLLLAIALLHPLQARAASFTLSNDPKKTCSAVEIGGVIQAGDYDRFVKTLKQAIALAPLRRIYLNSDGGNVGAALAITDVIRNTVPTVETIVQSRQNCSSACVIILTAGSRRYIGADARIVIHQALNEKTGRQDAEMTKDIGQYLALHGMPPDVMWTMGNLKPDEVLDITPSNAKRLGFGSFQFYGGSNPPATQQCSWDGFISQGP
jgi:hypothetical protein